MVHIKLLKMENLSKSYDEKEVANYMKNENIDIIVDLGIGKKEFTSYTMDLTKKYIEINSDYRNIEKNKNYYLKYNDKI